MTLTSLFLLCAPWAQTPPTAPWPPLTRAEWSAYSFQLLPDEVSGDYCLTAEVRAETGDPTARLAFSVVDDRNYYALELTRARVRLLRIESGLELPLGRGREPGLTGRDWRELLLRREGARTEVFLNGELVASAADDAFAGGKVGVGGRRGSVAFRDLREQDSAPAYLEDDFMRADGENGGWETAGGAWQVQSVGSPVRSTNAFNFTSGPAPKGARAICGDWFWHDYEVAASCQPHGPGQIGLYAHYRDPRNCYLFLLGDRADGVQLVRLRGGKRQLLAAAPACFQPGQWYRLALRVEGTTLTGLTDGREVLRAESGGLPGGRAGLHVRSREGATFDDFLVRQTDRLASSEDLGPWQALGGEWRAVGGKSEAPVWRGTAASVAKLLLGEPLTGDLALSARATRAGKGEVGLVVGWEDERNHRLLTCGGDPAALRLVRVEAGQATTEAEAPITAPAETVDLRLTVRDRFITAQAGGASEVSAWCTSPPTGRAGLTVRDGEASFTSVNLRRLPPLPEVARFEGAFTQEVSMADWAAENSDWASVAATAADPGPAYWHRSPAYGDCELSVRLKQPPAGPVVLMAGASERGAADGYRFVVTPGADGSAVIVRDGAPAVTERTAGLAPESISRLSLRRSGPLIVGLANDRPLAVYRDATPVGGLYCGFMAPAGTVDPAEATFRAEKALSYSFQRAPDEWWVGSGDWRVTNRWDCEPRWTFFIGGGKGVAALWNKHDFGPDVTLDFYGAIRFDSTRGYEYPQAANINCTVAADGRDLTTGYSLVFGGWDDQYTRLLRGTEVVAESTQALIPRAGSIHRQWFNLCVRKSGGRLRCWLDGVPVFDYTDPQPLDGSRVALWTYNNAIAVARVRIASNELGPGPPEPPTRTPRSCYDAAP